MVERIQGPKVPEYMSPSSNPIPRFKEGASLPQNIKVLGERLVALFEGKINIKDLFIKENKPTPMQNEAP